MSPRKQQNKKRILAAAEKLFAQSGFDATSVESIASRAGVNKALIYYYFKDKNDIINSLFLEIITQLNEHLKTSPPAMGPDSAQIGPREKLCQEIEFIAQRREIISVLFMEALKKSDRDDYLFKCAEMVMNHEMEAFAQSYADKRQAMPDQAQYLVYEFFTGFIPMLAFVALQDKWARYFNIDKKDLTDLFLNAFVKTHLANHGPT